MNMWKGIGNTTTLLFSTKELEILQKKWQLNIMVMEHFNSMLFRNSGPVNKQHTYQSTNQL